MHNIKAYWHDNIVQFSTYYDVVRIVVSHHSSHSCENLKQSFTHSINILDVKSLLGWHASSVSYERDSCVVGTHTHTWFVSKADIFNRNNSFFFFFFVTVKSELTKINNLPCVLIFRLHNVTDKINGFVGKRIMWMTLNWKNRFSKKRFGY